jgi:hypothetical protein
MVKYLTKELHMVPNSTTFESAVNSGNGELCVRLDRDDRWISPLYELIKRSEEEFPGIVRIAKKIDDAYRALYPLSMKKDEDVESLIAKLTSTEDAYDWFKDVNQPSIMPNGEIRYPINDYHNANFVNCLIYADGLLLSKLIPLIRARMYRPFQKRYKILMYYFAFRLHNDVEYLGVPYLKDIRRRWVEIIDSIFSDDPWNEEKCLRIESLKDSISKDLRSQDGTFIDDGSDGPSTVLRLCTYKALKACTSENTEFELSRYLFEDNPEKFTNFGRRYSDKYRPAQKDSDYYHHCIDCNKGYYFHDLL